jgi:TatA/E family protein of Tat protein translocase
MGGLGWSEILIILVVALIIFGPRKLPELGKTLGNSLAQFRRASEDFKRTWEDEVETEKRRIEPSASESNSPDSNETVAYNYDSSPSEPTEDVYQYGDAAADGADGSAQSTMDAPGGHGPVAEAGSGDEAIHSTTSEDSGDAALVAVNSDSDSEQNHQA